MPLRTLKPDPIGSLPPRQRAELRPRVAEVGPSALTDALRILFERESERRSAMRPREPGSALEYMRSARLMAEVAENLQGLNQ